MPIPGDMGLPQSGKERLKIRPFIRKCHVCGHVAESQEELKQCVQCQKSFLPLNYFDKIHAKNEREFENLFSPSDELHEDDVIKGLMVLW